MTIPTFNIYCDESCHLEFDRIPVMVLGAVWCPLEKTRSIFCNIRDLKKKHGLSKDFEIKWTKVSPAKLGIRWINIFRATWYTRILVEIFSTFSLLSMSGKIMLELLLFIAQIWKSGKPTLKQGDSSHEMSCMWISNETTRY